MENQTSTDSGTVPAVVSSDLLGVFLRILNEAYAADPAAMHALIVNRVPCNQPLAYHPTVQVEANAVASGESFAVGMLGVINGICEAATGKRVAVMFSEPDAATKRSKIVGFTEYSPNEKVQPRG